MGIEFNFENVYVSIKENRTIVFLSLIFYLSHFNKGKMLLVLSVS